MGMLSVGPLAIPHGVFAGLLAFLTFTILVSFAARRIDQKLERWSTIALVAGAVVARAVYVALHWATFSNDPLRALMLWQGGFEWFSGAATAIVSALLLIRSWRSRGVAMAILAISALVWVATVAILNDTNSAVPLPDITVSSSAGTDIKLRSYATGPVVVNLWATWCPPCRRELPAMVAQAAASPSVPFLFVNQAEDPATVQAFLKQQGLTLEHVLFDTGSKLARELHTVGIPITFFFYDGMMVDLYAGEISPEALRQKTKALINAR
ncbi:MAG: TlpA family protein disulfide reductase [Burkholderiaceae bacterium]|nr:TlpA family protein disulfide reductase [Burkholderiaceae bacterium]